MCELNVIVNVDEKNTTVRECNRALVRKLHTCVSVKRNDLLKRLCKNVSVCNVDTCQSKSVLLLLFLLLSYHRSMRMSLRSLMAALGRRTT